MDCFPIVGWNHVNRIPGATVQESSIGSLARTLLTSNTEIGIDFDTAERRVILVRDPEHTGFDGTVFDASWRACASGAAVSSNGEDPRPLLARCFAVTDRHRPFFFYNVEHLLCLAPVLRLCDLRIAVTLTQLSTALNDL